MIDISIIIVNYKTKNLVIDAIQSIYKHTTEVSFEIIIVDNNSNDGLVNVLLDKYPNVIFIQNDNNSGFGSANNIAIREANGKYIFLLNPDTLLLNNAIKYFYDYCELNQDKDIGCIGGFLEDKTGNIIHSYESYLSYWYDLVYITGFNIKKLINLKKTKFIKPSYQKFDCQIEVDYITGADLFITRESLNKIGLFDEEFFMYSEETDLQYRMMLKGYKRIIIPGPRIIHLEGQSFSLSNNRRIMMSVSKFKYVKKHKSIFHYYVMKSVYIVSGLIGTFADLYYKEYSYAENMNYIRCLVRNEYF
jgi:GT2 family glycosyltransferase